jgi:hypothetical protein
MAGHAGKSSDAFASKASAGPVMSLWPPKCRLEGRAEYEHLEYVENIMRFLHHLAFVVGQRPAGLRYPADGYLVVLSKYL